MNLKEGVFLHKYVVALKKSLQKRLQTFCTFIGLANDTVFVRFFLFYQKPEREKELKCFLLKSLVQI